MKIHLVKSLTAACLVAVATIASTGFAAAQTPTPPAGQTQSAGERLAFQFPRLAHAQQSQANHLSRLQQMQARAQTRLSELKAKGRDIAALQAALDAASGHLPVARTANGEAATLIAAHAGFDAAGKVTDVTVARKTLADVREKLRTAQRELADGRREVVTALRGQRRR